MSKHTLIILITLKHTFQYAVGLVDISNSKNVILVRNLLVNVFLISVLA